jgi:hypothetical protein
MSSMLSSGIEQTIINLAHSFDGYAYAKQVWYNPDQEVYTTLNERLAQVQESGKFFVRVEDNLAVNFYLHRTFHHWGWLPEAHSSHWYDMLFLYLHLYRTPVPEAHRHPELYAKWQNRPKGSAEAAAAEIRQVLRRGQLVS